MSKKTKEMFRALESDNLALFNSVIETAEQDDVNSIHKNGTLLTLASEKGLSGYVELLLKRGAKVDLVHPVHQTSAIHLAIQNFHAEVLQLLLNYNADVNCRQSGNGQDKGTPLHVLISQLEKGEDKPMKSETEGVKMRRNRWQTCFHVLMSSNVDVNAKDSKGISPLELAVKKKIRQFVSQLLNAGADPNFESDSVPTALQYCCKNEMEEAVKTILKVECDVNATSKGNSTPPLLIAADKGNVQILRNLVEKRKDNIKLNVTCDFKRTALHLIALNLPDDKNKFLECLSLLLEQKAIDVNAQDELGNTALHYAAQSGVEESVLQLLRSGSYLAVKNDIGKTAVQRMLPETLERFFDSCIQCKEEQASNNFAVTFDYSLFVPPKKAEPCVTYNSDLETVEKGKSLIDNRQGWKESKVLWLISQCPSCQHLVKHPLATSFLKLKWENIKIRYFINLGVNFISVALLSFYVHPFNSKWFKEHYHLQDILWWMLSGLFLIVLPIREVLHFAFAPMRYFFSTNVINIVMLLCTGLVLINRPESTHIAAVAVLFAWMQLMLNLGHYPKVSNLIAMFTRVLTTSVRLLTFYSAMLVGFALSFSLVFNPNEEKFPDIYSSLVKVTAMMTGELDYDELPTNLNFWTSRFLFLTFLLLITIVLFNLLVGFAVSDIQEIQNKAEIFSYIKQVEIISYLESMRNHQLPDRLPRPLKRLINGFRKVLPLLALFENCLPEKTYTIFPNKKISTNNPDRIPYDICRCHKKLMLSDEIIQNAYLLTRKIRSDHPYLVEKEIEMLGAEISNHISPVLDKIEVLRTEISHLYQLLESR